MLILTIRTDKPEAEIGLYENTTKLAYEVWYAHRSLAETIHQKIRDSLESNKKSWNGIEGIAVYQGPGSFTGLRIGITVANTIAEAQKIPIVSSMGETWIQDSADKLMQGDNDNLVLPEYGAPVRITQQKK